MLKTITIYGKELKTKEGKTFTKYSYTKDGKVFYQVKVAKDSLLSLGTKKGYLKITFNQEDCFIKKGKTITKGDRTFKENDTLWVLELKDIQEDKEAAKIANEKREAVMNAFFSD